MSNSFEFKVETGNRAADWQTANTYKQQYAQSGMQAEVVSLPSGGFEVRVGNPGAAGAAAAPAAPQGYGAQPGAGGAPGGAPGGYGGGAPGYGGAPGAAPGYGGGAPGGAAYGAAYGPPGGPNAPQAPQAQQAQYSGGGSGGGGSPGYGVAAAAGAGGAAAAVGWGAPVPAAGSEPAKAEPAVAPLSNERVRYLRKVYGLLTLALIVGIGCGAGVMYSMGTVPLVYVKTGTEVNVPTIVALFLLKPFAMYAAFGVLFVATLLASAVSKVPVLNVIALLGVAAIMGVELAPMVFVAQFKAGMLGTTLSANPVRDAAVMTGGVFAGITGYVFITRKDFSYLGAMLSMGFWVVLGACLLSFVFKSEVFALAVATAGALLSAGFLLYVTSYIFRNSEMDDAVGDALALLVQLRNLFMFLLRIFMSSKD